MATFVSPILEGRCPIVFFSSPVAATVTFGSGDRVPERTVAYPPRLRVVLLLDTRPSRRIEYRIARRASSSSVFLRSSKVGLMLSLGDS